MCLILFVYGHRGQGPGFVIPNWIGLYGGGESADLLIQTRAPSAGCARLEGAKCPDSFQDQSPKSTRFEWWHRLTYWRFCTSDYVKFRNFRFIYHTQVSWLKEPQTETYKKFKNIYLRWTVHNHKKKGNHDRCVITVRHHHNTSQL